MKCSIGRSVRIGRCLFLFVCFYQLVWRELLIEGTMITERYVLQDFKSWNITNQSRQPVIPTGEQSPTSLFTLALQKLV